MLPLSARNCNIFNKIIKTNFRSLSVIFKKSTFEYNVSSSQINSLSYNKFGNQLNSIKEKNILAKEITVKLYSLSSENSSPDTNKRLSDTTKPLSAKDQIKKAVKDYGSTVIVFHVAISLVSLGSFYMLVSSGIDIISILDWIGINTSKFVSDTSTFVLAYAVHKIFAPVRISITLGATPIIVRYLRKKNLIKK